MIALSRRGALAALAGIAASATLAPRLARADDETLAPLLQARDWLNGRPDAASLAGKPVLVDVFTFDCINCKNVVPNLRRLHARSDGAFAIVGVHTPETPYERIRSNVVAHLAEQGITWPVALDNDERIWNAYGITAWPTQLFFDRRGKLQATVVGDSQDDTVDATLRRLLA
ncbi:MAG: redoxin family protein [Vulcanimicrobiaceae bacterium]